MSSNTFRARASRALLVGLALFACGPAHALFDDDEARRRIEQTNQRLETTRRQLEDRITAIEAAVKSQGIVDLFNQMESLRGDLAKVRGQLEVITYELGEAQKRQRDLYVDLDSRMRRLETAAAASAAPAAGAGAPDAASTPGPTASVAPAIGTLPPGAGPGAGPAMGTMAPGAAAARPADASANEQRSYDAALDQFKLGNFAAAIAGFRDFVRTYPRSPLAASALYWVGNAQFAQRDFRGAITTQRQLTTAYPDSQKVPDALLNIASSQFELGDGAASRRTLEDLIKRYPQSEAAGKARQRLAIR